MVVYCCEFNMSPWEKHTPLAVCPGNRNYRRKAIPRSEKNSNGGNTKKHIEEQEYG